MLSKDPSCQQNQGLALLSYMFVLSGISRHPILEPDLLFTPNKNGEVLMETLQIENWTLLGTGVETLKGNKWSDLICCLGIERPKSFVSIRNPDCSVEIDLCKFVPPVLQRLLSDIPCIQILGLCSEM